MIKTLFLNINSIGSHTLDSRTCPFSQDGLALAEILEANGREVWLRNPYKVKSKQSSWPHTLSYNEEFSKSRFDEIIIFFQKQHFEQAAGRFIAPIASSPNVQLTIKMLYDCLKEGVHLYQASFDPKPAMSPYYHSSEIELKKRNIREGRGSETHFNMLCEILDACDIVVPDQGMIANRVIHNDIYEANVFSHTNKYLSLHNQKPQRSTSFISDFIYTGFEVSKYRQQRLTTLLSETTAHCSIYGPAAKWAPKWFDVADKKLLSHEDNIKLLSQSRFQLACGEPQHTFLTPRFFMAGLFGSIPLIDADYKAAVEFAEAYHLSEIIVDSTGVVRKWVECDDNEYLDTLYEDIFECFSTCQDNNLHLFTKVS